MFQIALLFFLCIATLFFPLLFWTYITSTFGEYRLGRTHFFMGIFLGAGVTAMVLASQYIPYAGGITSVFLSLSLITQASALGEYIFTLSILCSSMLAFFMGISYFFQNSLKTFVIRYAWAGVFFLQAIIFFALLISYLTQFFPQAMEDSQILFSGVIFSSFGLIVGYYITLAVGEEVGKYAASLTFAGRQEALTLGGTLLISTLIALGFSLVENIIYSYFYFERVGISGDLLRFILFRSIFSTTLHVLASLLLSYGFWYIIGQKISFSRVYFFLFLSFGLHSIFNMMLGFGYIFFLMVPLFGAYVFLSFLSEGFTLKQQEISADAMKYQ